MRARNLPAAKLLVTVALVAATAAACGSSSKTATPTTSPTTEASASVPTTPGITAPPTLSTAAPTKSFEGEHAGAFCDLIKKEEATFNSGNISTKTPADLKSLYKKLVPALEHAAVESPSAIKDDFTLYVNEFKKIDAALAAAGYNVSKVDPADLAKYGTPAAKTASANIVQYVTQVCHVTTPTT